MKHIYEGKTKTVFLLEDGNYLLKFKDDVTGENGKFDPGANLVGLSIDGMGKGNIGLSEYFFQLLHTAGIPTHFIKADLENAVMIVRQTEIFGHGLEVICRFRAVGSFFRRYGAYINEGSCLDGFVEVTIKDDKRNDPPISKDALIMLGILKDGDYETICQLASKISSLIKDNIATLGLELFDIKLEFGRFGDEIILIDEISAGNMRVYKNGVFVEPLDLVKIILCSKR